MELKRATSNNLALLANMQSKLAKLKEEALGLENLNKVLLSQNKEYTDRVTKSEKEISLLSACADFFNKTIDLKVVEVSNKIEEIINKGLAYIYGSDYVFKIHKTIKRNKTSFSFELTNVETGVSGFEETHGGGIMALISFLFRVVIIAILNKPRFLVLDETLNAVSIEYQEKLSTFIRLLAEDMNFNILLISHQPTLAENCHSKIFVTKSKENNTIIKQQDNSCVCGFENE